MAGLTEREISFIDEIAADINANGGFSGDIMADIKAAHERRQKFAIDMSDRTNKKAKMAASAIATKIWIDAKAEQGIDSMIFDCETV